MTETDTGRPTAVLAAVDTGEYDMDISLAELRELADSAGINTFGTVVQTREAPDSATFLGKGRLAELAEFVENSESDYVICDSELSPVQLRGMEDACGCPVIDRTMLILDIFAGRAVTAEGKLQVELARLRYQLPRLAGQGTQLSRQGGGGSGGTGARRGAGESQLETDRRHIRRRITALERELEEMTQRRERYRLRRKKDGATTVAIVGYTNVGKSTLLNHLTDAGVLAEDKLFATLDPTARALELPDGRKVMLVDTVGLVRRLPHHLVEAFKSTLEEAVFADLILNVCDITSPEMDQQLAVTRELLAELGADETPVITVLNKCDLVADNIDMLGERTVRISALTGAGCGRLLEVISRTLEPSYVRMKLLIPYSDGGFLAAVEERGRIFSREYTPEGTLTEANVDKTLVSRARQYIRE